MRSPLLARLLIAGFLLLLLPVLLQPAEALARTKKKHSSKKQEEPKPDPPAEAAPAPPPAKPLPPTIALASGLRFSIRPTLLGLVPPPDSSGYGECFVRVISAPGPASPGLRLQYELKEHQDDSKDARADQLDGVSDTRIRRGNIEVADFAAAVGIQSPLSWPEGGFNTQSGLFWLSPASYSALLRDGSIPWSAQAAQAGPADHSPAGAVPGSSLRLNILARKASYPCKVNGALLELPALLLQDSLGEAEYWLLADPANPLILKQSFLAPPLVPETGAASSAEQKARSSAHRGDESAAPGAAAERAAATSDGAGFAIVSIDF